jgi:hypothetical protein
VHHGYFQGLRITGDRLRTQGDGFGVEGDSGRTSGAGSFLAQTVE